MSQKLFSPVQRIKFILLIFVPLLTEVSQAQWPQVDTRLSDTPDTSYGCGNQARSVAANGDVVHVVWQDYRDVGSNVGNFEIYYKRSTNGGFNWGADTRLTNNPAVSISPVVAVSGSFVHVIWIDGRPTNTYHEVYYKRSTDGGTTWGPDVQLTNNQSVQCAISLAVSVSDVHIVWDDDRNANEVYYIHSTDGGSSWGTETQLSNSSGTAFNGSISVSGSDIHVVWMDMRHYTHTEIYYKRSANGGISWGADTRLTYGNVQVWSMFPTLAASGSVVHVVWNENDSNGNEIVYYKRSTDGGITWGQDIPLTNNPESDLPSVAVSGSVVHIVWMDNRDGNYEIYYKRSADGGNSWGLDIRLTNNSDISELQSVAVSGSTVHVVWSDTRDGYAEVYYKRDPTGNVPVELTAFSGTFDETTSSIILKWRTATETNNHGFEIERMMNGVSTFGQSAWRQIGFIKGNGTTTSEQSYSFIDHEVKENGTYLYRLKQIDTDGSFEYSHSVEVDRRHISSFLLERNFPNPFNQSTIIKYAIPEDGSVRLRVFDIYGREIITVVDDQKQAGSYQVAFERKDLPNGTYICRLDAGERTLSRVMYLVK